MKNRYGKTPRKKGHSNRRPTREGKEAIWKRFRVW